MEVRQLGLVRNKLRVGFNIGIPVIWISCA